MARCYDKGATDQCLRENVQCKCKLEDMLGLVGQVNSGTERTRITIDEMTCLSNVVEQVESRDRE